MFKRRRFPEASSRRPCCLICNFPNQGNQIWAQSGSDWPKCDPTLSLTYSCRKLKILWYNIVIKLYRLMVLCFFRCLYFCFRFYQPKVFLFCHILTIWKQCFKFQVLNCALKVRIFYYYKYFSEFSTFSLGGSKMYWNLSEKIRIYSILGPNRQACLAFTDSCPENWLRYGDFCFSFDNSRRYTYGKAEEKCRERHPGASVVTPQTPEQNKQLQEVVEHFR